MNAIVNMTGEEDDPLVIVQETKISLYWQIINVQTRICVYKISWDFEIHANYPLPVRRQSLVLIFKKLSRLQP